MPKVYLLVTWDDDVPMVRHYEDASEAVDIYKTATAVRDSAYLYSVDPAGSVAPVHVQGW